MFFHLCKIQPTSKNAMKMIFGQNFVDQNRYILHCFQDKFIFGFYKISSWLQKMAGERLLEKKAR